MLSLEYSAHLQVIRKEQASLTNQSQQGDSYMHQNEY